MRNYLFLALLSLLPFLQIVAQENDSTMLARITKIEDQLKQDTESIKKLHRLKISGYIQGEYQFGQENATLKVGVANENTNKSFHRFGIRRGRLKFSYEYAVATGVVQIDATEKGVNIKDVYIKIKEPFLHLFSVTTGVFNRPFGDEISYSSSLRESPERSKVIQTLFPEERDLGIMLTVQADKKHAMNFMKLEAGIFAGNGIKMETDNQKDFIGHLSLNKSWDKIAVGGGVSYYLGGVYQGTDNVYNTDGNGFVLDRNEYNKGRFAKREYLGLDAQLSIKSILGNSQIRAEALIGKQPSRKTSTKSPNATTLPNFDTYNRDVFGGYIIFVQSLGKLPVSAVFKYDIYDPNIRVSKDEVGVNNTTSADIMQDSFGFGLLWNINQNIRMQAYFDINRNETTNNLSAYQKEIKDNTLTIRLQYKF